MLVFPNAKVNLGLRVLGKRADGFHNIETCLIPVPFCDALEINRSAAERDELSVSGLLPDCLPEENLVIKAVELLRESYSVPPLRIRLHKCIPAGAGLGGGSSDAAFTLAAVSKLCGLNVSPPTLLEFASRLGSDVPFFLENKPVLAVGRGDIFRPLKLSLGSIYLKICIPSVKINTTSAYASVRTSEYHQAFESLLSKPECWKECLNNAFEENLFEKHPEIRRIKDEMYEAGALYASLSGSGSAVFGLFWQNPADAYECNNMISRTFRMNLG
jgi:4-diphosphocytidyl-2-C-methyl-D-erythritol kinase